MTEPPVGVLPTKVVGGARIPDLPRIPKAQWRAALVPHGEAARFVAASDLYLTVAERAEARALLDTLPPPPSADLRRVVRTELVPTASLESARRTTRQMNVRLDRQDYEGLAIAGRILGVRPTQVARMLINAGVRRLLAEHDVAVDEARRAGTLEA
jgi:hypothetical protein